MGELEDEPISRQGLEDLLRPVLRDGDSFLVAKQAGLVFVEERPSELPSTRSALRSSHPRLYGYLLGLDQRLNDAGGGCGVGLVVFLAASALCFGISAQGFHGFFPDDPGAQRLLDACRSNWVYAVVWVVGIALWLSGQTRSELAVYKRERRELESQLGQANMDVYDLIATMEGDEGLDNVSKHIKGDRHLSRL